MVSPAEVTCPPGPSCMAFLWLVLALWGCCACHRLNLHLWVLAAPTAPTQLVVQARPGLPWLSRRRSGRIPLAHAGAAAGAARCSNPQRDAVASLGDGNGFVALSATKIGLIFIAFGLKADFLCSASRSPGLPAFGISVFPGKAHSSRQGPRCWGGNISSLSLQPQSLFPIRKHKIAG